MFDHVKFGASDYAASRAFFLKALEPLGVTLLSEGPPTYGVELGRPDGKSSLCICQAAEKPAHLHLAFKAKNRQQVESFYRKALEAGGKDNGAPGLRPHYHANYYAAFVIGPDGHNIEVVCPEPEGFPEGVATNTAKLVDSYFSVWNQADPSLRSDLLASIWALAATYTDPTVHAASAQELLAHIADVRARRPGAAVVRTSAVDVHHGMARFAWRVVQADGTEMPEGIDIAFLSSDGLRIERVIGFFGPVPRS
jgi:catechol 2,3-dioxygenase-like lactoylglutathione lyase family enzyme